MAEFEDNQLTSYPNHRVLIKECFLFPKFIWTVLFVLLQDRDMPVSDRQKPRGGTPYATYAHQRKTSVLSVIFRTLITFAGVAVVVLITIWVLGTQ